MEGPLTYRYRLAEVRGSIRPREARPTKLYFIQAGLDGPIKIGRAVDPRQRLAQLQTASPYELRLLASWDIEDGISELAVHARFEDAHLRGEWFEPVPELLRFVEEIA